MFAMSSWADDPDAARTARHLNPDLVPRLVLAGTAIGVGTSSLAAVARGFQAFDPDLDLAGFVLNRVGSARHPELVTREVEAATGRRVLGALPKSAEIELPERHLGLIPSSELGRAEAVVGRLGEL